MPKAFLHHHEPATKHDPEFTMVRVEGQHGYRYFGEGWDMPTIIRKLSDEGINCSQFYRNSASILRAA